MSTTLHKTDGYILAWSEENPVLVQELRSMSEEARNAALREAAGSLWRTLWTTGLNRNEGATAVADEVRAVARARGHSDCSAIFAIRFAEQLGFSPPPMTRRRQGWSKFAAI